MELLASSQYGIKGNYPLEVTQVKTLYMLYQPLIGYEGVTLYLTLASDVKQLSLSRATSLVSRILKITGMSLKSFNDALKKLEALKLVTTYLYQDNQRYLLEINPPLEPLKFLENSILNTLLKDRLGEDDYAKTVLNYKIPIIKEEFYQDVSSRFGDVFEIVTEGQQLSIASKSIINKPQNRIFEWDYSSFEQELANYQIPAKIITPKIKERIIQLGHLYQVDVLAMLAIVRQSLDGSQVNLDQVARLAQDHYELVEPRTIENVYRYQPVSPQQLNDVKDKHLYYLKTASPFEILQDHQGGVEPVRRDLQVVEAIMSSLRLNVEVMNVLIEFTLMVCDNKIVKAFMETHGASWRRSKIETAEQAIAKAREYRNYQSASTIKIDDDKAASEYKPSVDESDLEEILDSFN